MTTPNTTTSVPTTVVVQSVTPDPWRQDISKLGQLVQSRKFWSLVVGELTTAGAYLSGTVDARTALAGALGMLATFIIATAVEDAGAARTGR